MFILIYIHYFMDLVRLLHVYFYRVLNILHFSLLISLHQFRSHVGVLESKSTDYRIVATIIKDYLFFKTNRNGFLSIYLVRYMLHILYEIGLFCLDVID
jgi:hypothetical protein